jgi:hypothetical protein
MDAPGTSGSCIAATKASRQRSTMSLCQHDWTKATRMGGWLGSSGAVLLVYQLIHVGFLS